MEKQARLLRIAALAVLLMTAAAVAYVAYSWSRRDAIDDLHEKLEQRLQQFSLSVLVPADKYAYLPDVISNYLILKWALQHPQDARRIQDANEHLQRLNAGAGSSLMYLLDLRGKTIAASNWNEPDSLIGNNYGFRPYFLDAIRDGKASFYGMGVTTGIPGYYVSHIITEGSTPLGVIVVKADMRAIAAGWNTGNDEVMLTDKNGVIFLSSREEWKYRPMAPLNEATILYLKRTRQYETVLKDKAPLRMTVLESLRPDEQVVRIVQQGKGRDGSETISYFMKSHGVPGTEWTIRILTPMTDIDANAMKMAILAACAMGLFFFSFMYLHQVRNRHREREESRRALEQALQGLEEKHYALQSVSEELRRASITDPLTGAYNRRFFMESIEKTINAVSRHRYPLSVVVIDADHFKQINDEHGHLAGDKVLQTLAAIYLEELRDSDVFARFGGEEFILALPHTNAAAARAVAERLREKVMKHRIDIDGQALSVTVSSGVSQYRASDGSIDDAVRRADGALYEAKKAGRNRVVVCE